VAFPRAAGAFHAYYSASVSKKKEKIPQNRAKRTEKFAKTARARILD